MKLKIVTKMEAQAIILERDYWKVEDGHLWVWNHANIDTIVWPPGEWKKVAVVP